jgi:hypothetical protein
MNLPGLRTRHILGALSICGLLSFALCLCGCTAVAGSGPATLVRVIDAAYSSPALDAYVSSTPIAVNFTGPSISNYAFVPPGNVTINLYPTGKKTSLAQMAESLDANQQHSVYITGQGSNFRAILLTDQNTPAPSGFVSIRFLQQAVSTGAVDIYIVPDGTMITAAKPLLSALAPGTVTVYTNVAAGTYDLIVVPAGTTKNAYTSAATTYTAGQALTILIVDQQLLSMPPVNVLSATDFD